MDDNGLIYGLELQARALAPQNGETNEVRFFIATNSLKPTNQVHLLDYEEKGNVNAKIFEHSLGEVWKINTSCHDSRLLATCYNTQKTAQVLTQAALLTLPENLDELDIKSEFFAWDNVEVLDTMPLGEKVKTVEFHPTYKQSIACVVDGKVALFDRTESKTRIVAEVAGPNQQKNTAPFTTGKWSHHHQGNQFLTLHDYSVRSYDVRDLQHCAWSIEDAHSQLIRDLDCNPNKQCHIVTGGDDGCIKVWDCRMPKEPVFARNDHAHWVWCVRFNTFHDQLILSSSSDCKVLLTCAGSVSSETIISTEEEKSRVSSPTTTILGGDLGSGSAGDERRRVLADGLLQTFDQHEDSVYCVEWSNVDPWLFASLSYDGRVLISRVPKQYKYQIIF